MDTSLSNFTELISLLNKEPLHSYIISWIMANDDVINALKILVKENFISARAISIVYNPDLINVKQSVGMFVVDRTNFKIKQDYILWFNDDNLQYFTGLPKDGTIVITDNIKPIKFLKNESIYGPDGMNFYKNHHPKMEDISPEIRLSLEQILRTAEPGVK